MIMEKLKNLDKELVKALIVDKNVDDLISTALVAIYIMRADITPYHLKLLNNHLSSPRTLSMGPRGSGKSYILTTAYSLMNLLKYPEKSIAVACKKQGQAQDLIRQIKNFLQDDYVKEMFGDLQGDLWNETSLNLTNKTDKTQLEPSITAAAVSADTSFISKHFDIIILDDIVGVENSRTVGQREKLIDFYNSTIVPASKPTTEIHCIGTHYHWADFWVYLEGLGIYKILKMKAIDNGKSYWEEWVTLDELLLKKKEIGTKDFNMQYQMTVEKQNAGLFKTKWINYYTLLPEGNYTTIISVDPAISQKDNADYFVLTVAKYNNLGIMYIVDQVRDKLTVKEQVNLIQTYSIAYPQALRIGIESVAYQSALYQLCKEAGITRVVPIKTVKDKTSRFSSFSARFEAGEVFINKNLPTLDILIDEMVDYPGAPHDDTIDSVVLNYETYLKSKITQSGGVLW